MTATAQETKTHERRRWIALGVVCLGQLMIVLDGTIVNVALPAIQRDLDFSQENLTWVVNAYMITFGSFLLLAGRLGDLVGRKRVFLTGIVMFTTASVLCGFANSEGLLIAARFLQGLGGAVASAVVIALIVVEFPNPRERSKAMSALMFISVAGGSVGLLAGGVLTQAIDWHWIFFINVPVGVIAFVLGSALLDESEALGLEQGVDWLGSALVTIAMMVGVYAIVTSAQHGWGSAHTLGYGAVSLALLAAFFALEARVANPIMPLRILRSRSLVGSSVVRGLVITGMFSTFFLGALYLEHVLGYSAIKTGLAFLPMTLTVGALSLGIVAAIEHRLGSQRTLVAGLVLCAAGLGLLTQLGEHASYFPGIFAAYIVIGLGAGTAFLPLLTIAMADVPPQDAGLGSAIVNVSMQISGAVGLAVLGTLATDHARSLAAGGASPKAALTGGFHLGFAVGAACVAAGLLLTLVLPAPDPAKMAAMHAGPAAAEAEAEAEPAPA